MADTPKTNNERLAEITSGIEQGIQDLFQSDRYAQYLVTMSRFHKYSVNNQMLIWTQRPNATLVASFSKWRDQFERSVRKGEKGIQIIAPTPFKRKMEMEKIDPDTQAPVLNPDGTVVMEEKEIQIPMYKPVFVFDVGQTEGKPLPSLATDLTGNVQRYDFFMEALRRSSPVPMEFEVMSESMDGYFSEDEQRIAIREGMSETQTVVAAVHEITHSKLHNKELERLVVPVKEGAEPPAPKDNNTKEVEAESVGYAVCQYYGIETGENSFGYIATWSKDKTLPELQASMETINKTASGLISDIDRNFREVVKEYDVVLEAWAADYADYIHDNSGNSLILATRDELITEAVDDIKRGDSRFPRTAILDTEMGAINPATELYRRLNEIEKNYPPVEHELMLRLDDGSYLHMQTTFDGYDYTRYDESLREIDGGIVDYPHISFDKAYEVILELEKLQPESVEKVSLDILDEIAAVRQTDIEEYLAAERGSDLLSETEAAIEETLASPRINELIATYEELFVDRQEDRKVQWIGDYHLYVPKDGVSQETQYEAYLVALDALGISHDEFLGNDRYSERGKIMVDLCRRAQMDIPEHIFTRLSQSERLSVMEGMSAVERWEADHIVDFTVTEQTVISPTVTPDPPEQAYHYPMPDPDYSVADLEDCGYLSGDMLPLGQLRALELYDKDLTIYVIDNNGEASMVFDSSEIENHGGLFAVPYDEWELVKNELAPAKAAFTEQDFLEASHDAYAIYQVKQGEIYRDFHFQSLDKVRGAGLEVQRDNYNFIYAGQLEDGGYKAQKLEALYQQFNINHPADFKGHSLSVSDIIALNQSGNVTYHYCDSFGFQELPGFNSGKNPLRSVEDAIEQNDNNFDGIINNVVQTENSPKPVYRESLSYAREHDEIDVFIADKNLNAECRDAIHAAINASRYDTDCYKMKDAVKQVVDDYGLERVELLMAKIVRGADWDGRYSRQNKEWAKGFVIPQSMKDIYSDTHPCLLDGFLDRLREKPSVLEKLKHHASQQERKKTAPRKSAEMEL